MSRVEPGQVLAEAVGQGPGQALLAAGTKLDAGHIEMMRQRGVLLVTIESPEGNAGSADEDHEIDPAILKQVLLEESQWFGETRKHPLMAEVFRFVVARRARERAARMDDRPVESES